MDVLPLYIVLLLWFCADLVAAVARALARADRFGGALYADVDIRLEFRGLSERHLGVQSLRLAIAVRVRSLVRARRRAEACALDRIRRWWSGWRSPICCSRSAIAMTWYFPRLGAFVPKFVGEAIYPIDKTNLDVLRILHFLSLAVITVWFVPRDWPALKSRVFWPAIVCGQHSLEIFCLGVFLSFAGHFVFTEVSNRLHHPRHRQRVGIAIMVAAAALVSWYRRVERQGPGPRPPSTKPGYAGGDA